MKTKVLTKEGHEILFATIQFGNGILVETSPKTNAPEASFDDETTYHKKLREKVIREGGEVIQTDDTPRIGKAKRGRAIPTAVKSADKPKKGMKRVNL